MHGYVETSVGLRPILLDRIQTVHWNYPGIVISYLGQNNVINGNISIVLNPKNDANIYGDSAGVLTAFWNWVADISSGAAPGRTLNQYLPNFTIDSVNSMNITGYSSGGAGLEALLLNATDLADACAKDWSNYARDFIVLTNSGTNYPVVGYQVWTQLTSVELGEPQAGGVHPPDGTYAWMAPTFIANPMAGSDTSTGTVYYVTIKGGYINAAEVCENYILNTPSLGNGHYNSNPLSDFGCPDAATASCYVQSFSAGSPCVDNWADGEFGLTGIIPPQQELGVWNCFSGGFFNAENLTGARVFIKDSTGKWVPYTNQEPNIPVYANQLSDEVSFEQFDVDWSNFITDPAGAPVCTYASTRKQWVVNLTTGIIETDSAFCGGGGGEG